MKRKSGIRLTTEPVMSHPPVAKLMSAKAEGIVGEQVRWNVFFYDHRMSDVNWIGLRHSYVIRDFVQNRHFNWDLYRIRYWPINVNRDVLFDDNRNL